MHRLARNLALISLTLAISGCGPSREVWVTGKLTKGGSKYQVPADQRLNLTFYSMEPLKDGGLSIPAGQAYMAVYKPEDGTFTVPGAEGRGIPRGKYRVSLTQKRSREAVDKGYEKVKGTRNVFDRDADMLEGQFGESSPIVRDIKDSAEVAIDLDKPLEM